MKFRFLTPAETEMMEAAAYYEMQVEKLGEHFLDIIEAAVVEIADNPEIWPEIEIVKIKTGYANFVELNFSLPFPIE